MIKTYLNSTVALAALRAFDTPAPSMITTPEAVQAAKRGIDSGATMPGDEMMKRSSDSVAMLEYWDLTDTIVDGIGAMRKAGEAYLPKFVDEDDKVYEFRLKCTKLTNIYRDIVESLASKPFEKEVTLITEEKDATIPQPLLDFCEDVDGSGSNLTAYAGQTFFNGINSAIDWIFVDYSKPDPTVRSIKDARERGLRPYWSRVLGRNVLEVRSEIINGNEELTYMRIYEPGAVDHVRVFERVKTGGVTWKLYEKQSEPQNGKTAFALIDQGAISIGVIPLTPFITGRRDGRSWRFFPAMRDAADLQVDLYQSESGLKHLKILAGYPMLSGQGVKPELNAEGKPKRIAVGPGRVLYSPPNAQGHAGEWKFVQPDAQLFKTLAEDIKETISQLREIGRQPLTAQSGNLTVITTAVAAGKAKSAVAAWGNNLKNTLENAMVITAMWLNIKKETYDPIVDVYTDFDDFTEGKDLESLDADRERGDISRQTLWDEKKRRGVYGPDFTAEREEERLLAEVPSDGEDSDLDPKKPEPEDA